MKKVYENPEILFESFSLSTNIAGGCESIVGNPSKGACAIITSSGDKVFSGDICDFKPEELGGIEDQWDGFCYHVHIDTKNLFNS